MTALFLDAHHTDGRARILAALAIIDGHHWGNQRVIDRAYQELSDALHDLYGPLPVIVARQWIVH